MPRDVATEQPAVEVCRYLRYWTHAEFIEEELQKRHGGLSADQRRRKARDVVASVAQGLELLGSAGASSLLTKPLPLFYAAEAFAKALCIMRDPSLEGGSFRAHGLSGIKKRRYFIKTLACRVQAPGSDVWSRLSKLVNADWVAVSVRRDGEGQRFDWRADHGALALPAKTELVLGELLRHLPELSDDLRAAGWNHPYVVQVARYNFTSTSSPPHSDMEIVLRHGRDPDVKSMLTSHENGRGHLARYTRIRDVLDVVEYRVTTEDDSVPGPNGRTDIFGGLYFDFSRGRRYLGELLVYYAALFVLADVVRYQGQWARLLEERPAEEVLIDRFLDVAARKLPNLALNELGATCYFFRIPA